MKPVYDGMPPVDRVFDVPKNAGGTWGNIRCGGACKDDYARINIYHQVPGVRFVKLQKAALDSFRAAEEDIGGFIFLTGSWRSCQLQGELFKSDSQRFADPHVTAHTRGLAIDVSQNAEPARLRKVHDALSSRAWHQSRPDDEPWHYSFGLNV